jgi:hypothetical protein
VKILIMGADAVGVDYQHDPRTNCILDGLLECLPPLRVPMRLSTHFRLNNFGMASSMPISILPADRTLSVEGEEYG